MMISNSRRIFTGFIAFIVGVATFAVPAIANPVADFYAGKKITAISGGGAGGGFSLAARILGRHMTKYIPGQPEWVVDAMPGAGGARSVRYIYNAAAQDGTVIGVVLPSAVLSPLLRKDVGYDSAKLRWIGSITAMPSVFSVWHTAPAKSLEDMRRTEIISATSNKLSNGYMIPAFLNAVAGTRIKIIMGYDGADRQNVALETGEVHARGSWYASYQTTKADWLRDRKLIHVAYTGPQHADLQGVPHLIDLARNDAERQMVRFMQVGDSVGHGFFVSPNVPAARVAALRAAFDKTVRDPEFLAEAEKRHQVVDPVRGADLDKTVAEAMNTSRDVVTKFGKLIDLETP